MQTFSLYLPPSPNENQRLLFSQEHPFQPGTHYYFVREMNHILIYREEMKTNLKTSEKKLLANQIEIPMEGISWFIDVMEKKFFEGPEDDSLPANKISYEEVVAGERLHILRAATAGCEYPGYDLTNLSRQSYILASCKQDVSFADPWLFEFGLMDFLKKTAHQYEMGKL